MITPRARSVCKRIARTKGERHVRGRLWYAMRVLRSFTVFDLMAVAEVESKRSVLAFLGLLGKAGFVSAKYGNRGRHEVTQFRLVRNSGPKCPSILRAGKVVLDHNTLTEYPTHVDE